MLGEIAFQAGEDDVVDRVFPAPADGNHVIDRLLERAIRRHPPSTPATMALVGLLQPPDILRTVPLRPGSCPRLPFPIQLPQSLGILPRPLPVLLPPFRRTRPDAVLFPEIFQVIAPVLPAALDSRAGAAEVPMSREVLSGLRLPASRTGPDFVWLKHRVWPWRGCRTWHPDRP